MTDKNKKVIVVNAATIVATMIILSAVIVAVSYVSEVKSI